jgi:hypothetical protein
LKDIVNIIISGVTRNHKYIDGCNRKKALYDIQFNSILPSDIALETVTYLSNAVSGGKFVVKQYIGLLVWWVSVNGNKAQTALENKMVEVITQCIK